MQKPQDEGKLPPQLWTISQICQALNHGRTKMYELIRKEHLPVKRCGRAVRTSPVELQRCFEEVGQQGSGQAWAICGRCPGTQRRHHSAAFCLAAEMLGRESIGIEQEAEDVKIAKALLEHYVYRLDRFRG